MDRGDAKTIIDRALADGRTMLTARECEDLLSIYDVPIPRGYSARTLGQAREAAEALGFPVVLKIDSVDIIHKSDVGGVRVNISSTGALEDAYATMMASVGERCPGARIEGVLVQPMVKGKQEVIVGLKRDAVFGPVVLVGLGGIFVELLRDVSARICPVSREDVLEMVQELKGYPLLTGFRGSEPVDLDALADLTLKVSRLAMDLPAVAEMDLNPVMVNARGQGCTAVDFRVIVRG